MTVNSQMLRDIVTGNLIPLSEFDGEQMLRMGIWPYLSGQKLTLAGYGTLVEAGFTQDLPYSLGDDILGFRQGEHWVIVGIAPDLEQAFAAQGAS